MNKCGVCGTDIPEDHTICYDCAKKFADEGAKMWMRRAEELKEECIKEMQEKIAELELRIHELEEERNRPSAVLGLKS